MNVSQCNAPVCVMNVFVFILCSGGDTYRIDFYVFEVSSFFELEAIPFRYRLLELMTKRIGYQVLIKC